ncbi:MAG: hypothetical protein IJX82_09545 [Clostridia bacterium]|nr:hypothetical protein [Clostridia bacterium]
MKRACLWLCAVIFLCASMSGCDSWVPEAVKAKPEEILKDGRVYPLYDSLSDEDQQLYLNICRVTTEQSSADTIGVYESEEELDAAVERVRYLYRQIFFEQSEMFWVDPYNFSVEKSAYKDTHRLVLKPTYLVEKAELPAMKEAFRKKVDGIVAQAEVLEGDFEKALFVHDYILKNASYDHSLAEGKRYDTMGINAYGCLMEGKTICSGYTLAFDLLMKRLGYECGAEFNNYGKFSLFDGHVWNYCKLGDEYYYFDLTWDDTAFESEYYQKYMEFGYNYFGVTKEELAGSNFTLSRDAPTPPCNGKEFNYFVYKGLNLPVYTEEDAEAIIKAQEGQGYAVLRFDSYGELLKAQTELIEKQEIYSMVPGLTKLSYVVSKSNLHLYIFFEE